MRSAAVSFTARAPRVLVPFAHPDQLDRVLEWFGRVWGGAHMLCVPVGDAGVADILARLATVYDPDLVLSWQPTIGSLAHADLAATRQLVNDRRVQTPDAA